MWNLLQSTKTRRSLNFRVLSKVLTTTYSNTTKMLFMNFHRRYRRSNLVNHHEKWLTKAKRRSVG
jgi:hypothetical protein